MPTGGRLLVPATILEHEGVATLGRTHGRLKLPVLVAWLVLLGGGGYAGFAMRNRPLRVEVERPRYETVVESVSTSGRVHGSVETDVGAAVGGRVARLLVAEGESVRAGQVVAQLETGLLDKQVTEAQGSVATAHAQLARARAGTLAPERRRVQADTRQTEVVARAALEAAKQRLAELRNGPERELIEEAEARVRSRRAQVAQAQQQVAQAAADLRLAESDLDRWEALGREGAASRADVERGQARVATSRAALESARGLVAASEAAQAEAEAQLRKLKAGTRPEAIAQAEADLAAAKAALAGATNSGAAQRALLLATPRAEDVAVAEAQLRQAEGSLATALARRDEAMVRAPMDGKITQLLVWPGGLTGPSQPILRMVSSSPLEVWADIDENYLGRLTVGQEALLSSGTIGAAATAGRVSRIAPSVDADRGTVELRIVPVGPSIGMRPGQTVSVNIIVDRGSRRLTVPLTAVSSLGSSSSVLVVEGGKLVSKPVQTGPPGEARVPVIEGLDAEANVVIQATGLAAGKSAVPVPHGSH